MTDDTGTPEVIGYQTPGAIRPKPPPSRAEPLWVTLVFLLGPFVFVFLGFAACFLWALLHGLE